MLNVSNTSYIEDFKMFQSLCEERGKVTFPVFTGERVYMQEFRKKDGLPKMLLRWQPTVNAMLEGVDTDGPIYLMIDQGVVKANATHRRPGLHIDGYWNPGLQSHGGGRPGHRSAPARHSPLPTHISGAGSWSKASYEEHEGLILASDVRASRAVVGSFLETPADMGDCSHVNTFGMKEIILSPNTVYAGNVTMLHESIPVPVDCQRTLVRLNVPGWTVH